MEQLWSYLHRMARTTKEMRPSHCIDVFTCALLHYGDKINHNRSLVLYMYIIVCTKSCISLYYSYTATKEDEACRRGAS